MFLMFDFSPSPLFINYKLELLARKNGIILHLKVQVFYFSH